jgi:hypothetical protein
MYTISLDTAATHRHTSKVPHESLCRKLWHTGQTIQRRWTVSNCSTHLNLIQTEDEDFELAAIRPHILCTKLISVYTIKFIVTTLTTSNATLLNTHPRRNVTSLVHGTTHKLMGRKKIQTKYLTAWSRVRTFRRPVCDVSQSVIREGRQRPSVK